MGRWCLSLSKKTHAYRTCTLSASTAKALTCGDTITWSRPTAAVGQVVLAWNASTFLTLSLPSTGEGRVQAMNRLWRPGAAFLSKIMWGTFWLFVHLDIYATHVYSYMPTRESVMVCECKHIISKHVHVYCPFVKKYVYNKYTNDLLTMGSAGKDDQFLTWFWESRKLPRFKIPRSAGWYSKRWNYPIRDWMPIWHLRPMSVPRTLRFFQGLRLSQKQSYGKVRG